MKCRQCGKEFPQILGADICTDCARANLKKSLDANPELKKAFKEAVEETFSPENRKKMVDDTVRFMQALQVSEGIEKEGGRLWND